MYDGPTDFEVGYAIGHRKGRKSERAKIVAWMRTFPLNKHAREWADAIEAGEDATPGPDVPA